MKGHRVPFIVRWELLLLGLFHSEFWGTSRFLLFEMALKHNSKPSFLHIIRKVVEIRRKTFFILFVRPKSRKPEFRQHKTVLFFEQNQISYNEPNFMFALVEKKSNIQQRCQFSLRSCDLLQFLPHL